MNLGLPPDNNHGSIYPFPFAVFARAGQFRNEANPKTYKDLGHDCPKQWSSTTPWMHRAGTKDPSLNVIVRKIRLSFRFLQHDGFADVSVL